MVEELKGSIHLPDSDSGPWPLIVFIHGRHSTCRVLDTIELIFATSPCPEMDPVTSDIPSYRGYDYLAHNLASHGYVVVSASANGINSYDFPVSAMDSGMEWRAQLVGETIDLIANNPGYAPTVPAGRALRAARRVRGVRAGRAPTHQARAARRAVARARAREINQKGALFPWRTINGEEASAYYQAGTAQYHLNADIAYAIRRYVNVRGDLGFLVEAGAEMLVETARLWRSLGHHDAQGHFRIEGECTTDASLPLQRVNCPPVGYYTGAFDPASMSFTAEIPMKDIGAKPGSVIGIGQENICIICWVSQVAERSLNTTIIDYAGASKTYKVPR